MLSIVVSPGYMPRVGDRWEVLRLGVRRGTFGGVDTPELGDSLWWDTSRLLVDGSVSIVPSPGAAGLIVMAGSLLCARRRRA